MARRLHVALLKAYGRIPMAVRRRIVRLVAPSYTVGAVCLVERDDGAVLLVRQVYRDSWGVPGGLLAKREEPADAVRREVREEVGLEIELVGEPVVVVDPGPQRVDLVFRGRLASVDADLVLRPCSAEIEQVRWFARDELPEVQTETTKALVALARSSGIAPPRE